MKKTSLKENKILIYALAIVSLFLVPIMLNLLVFGWRLKTNIPVLRMLNTHGDIGDWLSFWGNLVGTLISGFVAFTVAKLTVNEQAKKDKRLETDLLIIGQLPALIKVRIEIEKVLGELLRIKKDKEEMIEECKEQGISVQHDELIYSLDYTLLPLNEENFKSIDQILHVDLQADLIELQDFYNSFKSALEFNITSSEGVVAEFNEAEIENRLYQLLNSKQQRNLNRGHEDIFELMGQIKINKEKRLNGWKKIEEEDYIDTLASMLIEVVNRIELIRKKTSEKSFYE